MTTAPHRRRERSERTSSGVTVTRDEGRRRYEAVAEGTALAGSVDDLHPFAQADLPFMRPSFEQLTTSTLVVAGDHDQSRMPSRGPDWFTDACTHSPGATDLLTLHGAEHALGGIVGYEVAETTDEHPERVAVVQRMSTAYLRTALRIDESSWPAARAAFGDSTEAIGHVDSKQPRAGRP
jgi:hypothetical protein